MNALLNAVETITKHYASPGLLGRIEAGLGRIGKSPQDLSLDDLAPVDEFHVRGPAATTELIEWLDRFADASFDAAWTIHVRKNLAQGSLRVVGLCAIKSTS